MRAPEGARRKAAASASRGQIEGLSLNGSMKGWRPPLQSQGFDPGSNFFAVDAILPDIGSIGLPLLPVLGPFGPPDRVPLSRNEAPGRDSRTNAARPSAIVKTAPALHLLQRDRRHRRARNEGQRNEQPGANDRRRRRASPPELRIYSMLYRLPARWRRKFTDSPVDRPRTRTPRALLACAAAAGPRPRSAASPS